MFEKYFNPTLEDLENLFNRILPQLFLLLPTLFIAPLGIILDLRRGRTWLLTFWMLPVLIIYMQMGWVGQVPVEDMRYFLPVLPPTAILSAHALCYSMDWTKDKTKHNKNKSLVLVSIVLLICVSFLMADYGISWQLHRSELGRFFNPPIVAIILILIVYFLMYILIIHRVKRSRTR
jgi:hypothetical protein